jgi:hypothetical protein
VDNRVVFTLDVQTYDSNDRHAHACHLR